MVIFFVAIISIKQRVCTGWSRENACFSEENNFMCFKNKQTSIASNKRYFNAALESMCINLINLI